MVERTISPFDEFSGLPLPLVPPEDPLSLDNGDEANWHHHFFPRMDPVLHDTLGGRALRHTRMQLVDPKFHNYSETAYHRFFDGPPIPTDPDVQFGMTVLSCAGYLSDQAIDLSSGEPEIVTLSETQTQQLTAPKEVKPPSETTVRRYQRNRPEDLTYDEAHDILLRSRERQASMSYRNLTYGYEPVRDFMADHVMNQDLSHLDKRLTGRFLATGDQETGLLILAQGARQAVEVSEYQGSTVAEVYREARDDGRLHPMMPPSAASLVKYKLGDVVGRTAMLDELRGRLMGGEEEVA